MSVLIDDRLSKPQYSVLRQFNIRVPMRDGVQLSIDIYRPDSEDQFPALLLRTPYDNDGLFEMGRWWAERGYVFAAQDVRGRYDSEGDFNPWYEATDGYDTIEWLAVQSWCNGKVGMAASSYLGIAQMMAASLQPPHLVALMPMVCPSDYYDSPNYTSGAFQLAVCQHWSFAHHAHTGHNADQYDWEQLWRVLPVADSPDVAGVNPHYFRDWLDHPTRDEYWEAMNHENQYQDMIVPMLHVGGWYDLYSKATLVNFSGMQQRGGSELARKNQKTLMGPWPHPVGGVIPTGSWSFGEAGRVDVDALQHRWFDHWLKGIDTGLMDEPPLRLFVMGANQWRNEYEWPLTRTEWTKWYFHSEGRANTLFGDGVLSLSHPGDEPSDTYTYDPDIPVPTLGGCNLGVANLLAAGIFDQRPVERRDDVLCFTSLPLLEDLEVTGPVKATLFISTTARDTDFTAKLIDVHPSGYAFNLCDGIIRARYHKSFRTPELLDPGRIYELEIDLWVTSNLFKIGHRIRVDISSSNFPRFDRNLNTGGPIGKESNFLVADQTLYHDTLHPSHIVLPVIPAGDKGH